MAEELKLATNHYVQYQIIATVIKLFLTLPLNCYHLNCSTLCDQRLNYIMASTYYTYAYVGLLWCSIMNMNSIHVATITYKELAYIFCESFTCLRYKLKNSGLCNQVVFLAICITLVGIDHIHTYKKLIIIYRVSYHRNSKCTPERETINMTH